MSPITQEKKQASGASKSELVDLQKHGMSADSMMGRDEIKSLVGERGKGPVDKMQSFVRGLAKGFFSRASASAKDSSAKK
jgi:hypothetical protein